MANMAVNAYVSSKKMQIILDQHQWVTLTIDGKTYTNEGSGIDVTVPVEMGKPVAYEAVVNQVEIINPNVDIGVNGLNYDGFWLKADFTYKDKATSTVLISGNLEWKNGYIHDAPNYQTFSQGKLTGSLDRLDQ